MHNGKYTSVREIYDRVTRTFDIDEFDPNEAAEHIADALSLLAIPTFYEDKVCMQEVVENRAPLPSDMLFLIQARYKPGAEYGDETYTAMRYAGNSFQNGYMCNESDQEAYGCNYFGYGGYYGGNVNPDITYTINKDYMHFNIKEGVAQLAYKSFPVDEDGYPMVPDDAIIKMALENYVLERMGYKLVLKQKLGADVYRLMQQERNWSMGKAQERGLTPSVDEMESLKNIWVRLIRRNDPHATYFSKIGQQERIRYQPTKRYLRP